MAFAVHSLSNFVPVPDYCSLLGPVPIAWSPEHVSCLLVHVGGMCAMYMSTCVCVYMYVCVCGNLRSSLVSSPDILHINFLDKVSF